MTTSYVPKQRKNIDVFWAEMAACDHCVQIYDNDTAFLNVLQSYVASALELNEAVIIIATDAHMRLLKDRLQQAGVDVMDAQARDQFVAVDAHAALASFMRDGWPDEALFLSMVRSLLERARARHAKVRAFGEMVALMWANGEREATIHLEHLWARLCKSDEFALFCAYPRAGFTQDAEQSMMDVCLAHSVVFNEA
jgi:hypothetical protein